MRYSLNSLVKTLLDSVNLLPYSLAFIFLSLLAGNSWGCDDTRCCIGCGEVQEEFYACADISIRSAVFPPNAPEITTTQSPPSGRVCSAIGQWKMVAGMDNWCKANCVQSSNCPSSHCACTGSDNGDEDGGSSSTGHSCVATGPWSGNSAMDAWCGVNCPLGLCPFNTCICS